MPETPIPNIETIEKQESVDQTSDVKSQLQANQNDLVKSSTKTIESTLRLNVSVDALENQRIEDLLKFATAKHIKIEIREVDEVTIKANVQKNIGDIFSIQLGQELTGATDFASTSDPSAKIGKTSLELKLKPGIILGTEAVSEDEKAKVYIGYTYTGEDFSITILGQKEQAPDVSEMSARFKAKANLSENMSAFADVTVGGIDNPGAISPEQMKAYLGVNFDIQKGQTLAVALDPKSKSGSISFIGQF